MHGGTKRTAPRLTSCTSRRSPYPPRRGASAVPRTDRRCGSGCAVGRRRRPRSRALALDALRHLGLEGPSLHRRGERAWAACRRSPRRSRPARSASTRWSSSRGSPPTRPRTDWSSGPRGSRPRASDTRATCCAASRPTRPRATTSSAPCRGPIATKAGDSRCMPSCPQLRARRSRRRSIGSARRSRRCPASGRARPVPARRADALVAICSARLGADPDPERATVVVHARAGHQAGVVTAAEIEGGGIAQPSVLERLLCAARVETVHEDADGPGDRGRPHHAGAAALAASAGPVSRRGLPVPGVRHARRSRRPTTSCSGATAAAPTSATSSRCAPGTTSSSTSTGGGSRATPRRELRWYRPDGARYARRSVPRATSGPAAPLNETALITAQRKSRDSRRSASTLPAGLAVGAIRDLVVLVAHTTQVGAAAGHGSPDRLCTMK